MADQLRHLLQQASPSPGRTLSAAAVAAEARRRRKRRVVSLAIAALIVVVGSIAALVGTDSHSDGGVSTVIATPTPSPTSLQAVKPSVSLSTAGPFRDGATVEVTGAGFAPNDGLFLSECPHGSNCDDPLSFGIGDGRADAQGSFSLHVTVRALVRGLNGSYVPCETACTLVVHSVKKLGVMAASASFEVIPPSLALLAPECTAAQLQATDAGSVSPETGERSIMIDLANISAAACGLSGYPQVTLLASGNPLPHLDVNGGAFIFETPRSIVLRPGQFAHVLIADSCCIASPGIAATALRLTLPVVNQSLDLALPSDGGVTQGGTLQIGPFAAGREVGG